MLLAAWTSKLLWVYSVFAVGIALVVTAFFFGLASVRFFSVRRQTPVFAYEGDRVTVILSFAPRWRIFSVSLELSDTFTPEEPLRQMKTIVVSGTASRRMEFSYTGNCCKRGVYGIGPIVMRCYDPFGLFVWQRRIALFSSLAVYPAVFSVRNFPFVLGQRAPRFGEQTTRQSGDYEEFYGIREYRQEDGWRRIHWRSSARLNELTVRHFEQSSQWRVMIILDGHISLGCGRGRDTPFEYGARIAASLARYLLMKTAGFGLHCSSRQECRIPLRKGMAQYYRVLDALARAEADGARSCAHYLAALQHDIPPHSSLIIITLQSQLTRALDMLLEQLRIIKYIGVITIALDGGSFPPSDIAAKPSLSVPRSRRQQGYFIRCQDNLEKHFAE